MMPDTVPAALPPIFDGRRPGHAKQASPVPAVSANRIAAPSLRAKAYPQ